MAKKKKKAKARKDLDSTLPVYQLKIALEDSDPAIWRRIQTPNCTLADLHEIIQIAMDWEGEHMYAFETGEEEYSDPQMCRHLDGVLSSHGVWLSDLARRGDYSFIYEYDFGDSWRHEIEIEATLPAEEGARYPRCIDGGCACPLEDCGGVYGYAELLEALAASRKKKETVSAENGDRDDEAEEECGYDERLEWLGEDFDPEAFSVENANEALGNLRPWIGRSRGPDAAQALFAVGDCVRVRSGVVHSRYPDIPLGGWTGTVAKIAWLVPISYRVQWSDETLAAAHPVYTKRCQRDEKSAKACWLDEQELEQASSGQPIPMEQPANLVVRPLSEDDEDDRVRIVLGLTSDDPLSLNSDEAEQRFLEYLRTHLVFPFEAADWSGDPISFGEKRELVAVLGFASPAFDAAGKILCEVRAEENVKSCPLARLAVDEDDPNARYLDDYRHWQWAVQNSMDSARQLEDEDYDDECDEDGEYWEEDSGDDEDDFDDDDFDDDDRYDEDYEDGDVPHDEARDGLRLYDEDADSDSPPKPIRREQPQVGRNDPCPCGSGKKFKKCCLKKSGTPEVE